VADSADSLIAEIREIVPQIAARASEIDAARTVPKDIVDELKRIGVFRMIVPKSHGGLELAFPDCVRALSEVSAADGSTGWIAMIGCGTPLLYSRLPRETFDHIYANGPDVIQAGAVHAFGAAEPIAGGYRLTGRWPFASGVPHADWILGGCKILKDGEPVLRESGQPVERLFTLPAEKWTIENTWFAGGLKGSASHHVSIDGVFVPEANVFDISGPPCIPGALYVSVGAFVPFFNAAFTLGLAEGAFKDIVALAKSGKQQYGMSTPIRQQPLFQYELGRAEGDLRAARAYLKMQVENIWNNALSGTMSDPALFVEGLQMNVWLTEACTRVIDVCYTLGGGTSVYDTSPLQRRLRDMHTAAQHIASSRLHYVGAGSFALGQRSGTH
jgi:indole-3-acetate monooxygenase